MVNKFRLQWKILRRKPKNLLFIFLGFDKIVDLLIRNHVDVNQKNNFGRTALQKAIETGKLINVRINIIDTKLISYSGFLKIREQ